MKIIITGCRGFIGKSLIDYFPKTYKVNKLYFKEYTVLKKNEFRNKVKNKLLKIKPDAVIHAATFFSKEVNSKINKKCFKINYEYSKIFIDTVIENKIKKIIYFGSNHEFEKNKKKLYPYLLSKKKFSNYLQNLENKKTKLTTFYIFNTFGLNDKRDKLHSKFFSNPEKLNLYKNLELNYININTLCNLVKKELSNNQNLKNKFISIINKDYFKIASLKKLNLNLLTNNDKKKLIIEKNIKIPINKKIIIENKKDSFFEFIKKNIDNQFTQ